MSVPFAFLAVIIIWSTTPLGIKWSIEEVGFMFGSGTRMFIGGVLAALVMVVMRHPFLLHRKALLAYLASGVGIYVAMFFGYWGATYIPSGWISVIWGISPVLTGIMASIILGEKSLVFHRMFGAVLGVIGLAIIFLHSSKIGDHMLLGVTLILIGVLGQTGTAVWIKHINAGIHGIAMTTGGLIISVPLFWLSWWIFDGHWPQHIPDRTLGSIVYLAVFGSVIGFSFYYYLLNHVEASRVSLITLVTPVTALILGHYLNHEALSYTLFLGTALILSGLFSFEWGGKLTSS